MNAPPTTMTSSSSSSSSARASAVPTSALHNGFGAAHLAKLGWAHGQGLGKSNQGMTTHIRVSRKIDKGGIASKKDDFGFQWWDHLYNKSAVTVTLDKEVESEESEEEEAVPEVKKVDPLMAMFVKSDRASEEMDTLDKTKTNKKGKRETKEDQADKDNYCIPLTDAELLAICGGRTAAKGARFDYSSSGKVARADTELGKRLAELGVAASSSLASTPSLPTPSPSPSPRPGLLKGGVPVAEAPQEDGSGDMKEGKKSKKKRSRDGDSEAEDHARRERKRAKKEAKRNGDGAKKVKKEKKSKRQSRSE